MRFGAIRMLLTASIVSATFTSAPALAEREGNGGNPGNNGQNGNRRPGNSGSRGNPSSVPEFDPGAVGAIAALVAGGGVLLARRRSRS